MDNSAFPWQLLKSEKDKKGGRAFEDIACRYVEAVFKQFEWKRTNLTRDGNRDAYAVISLFSVHQDHAEVWMEAKYSVSGQNMSRYVIDKTIVSALSYGNVSEIFFVTNMLVTCRVKEQVLSALKIDGFTYNDIHFCTKYDLEIWLTNTRVGQSLFMKYFCGCHPNIYKVKGLKVLGDLSFFDANVSDRLFMEPINVLKTGKEYVAEMRVFCQKAGHMSMRTAKGSCIHLQSSALYTLRRGVNELTFAFTIEQASAMPKLILTHDETKVNSIVELSIPILSSDLPHIEISSQEKLRQELLQCFGEYNMADTGLFLRQIIAPAGMGKSYLLEKITEDAAIRHKDILYYTFYSANIEKNRQLAELYLRLFYFSASIQKHDDMSELLKGPEDLQVMLGLLADEQQADLEKWMESSKDRKLVPMELRKDRIIILDNIDRLSESQGVFLMSLINRLRDTKGHFFVILSGRQPLSIANIELMDFNIFDITNNLRHALPPQQPMKPSVLYCVKENVHDVSSLLFVIEQIRHADKDEIMYKLTDLKKERGLEIMIRRRFDDAISSLDSVSRDILLLVYTLLDGLSFSLVVDKELLQPLFKENLIKDGMQAYLPMNNLMKKIYRAYYTSYNLSSSTLSECLNQLNTDEKLRLKLGSCDFMSYIQEALVRTEFLMEKQDYVTIAYILEPLFSPLDKKHMDHLIEQMTKLKFNYIYAKANVDTYYDVRKEFSIFAEKIQFFEDETLQECRVRALSEVVCFAFEDADFPSVRRTANEVHVICSRLTYNNKIRNALLLCDNTLLLTLYSEDNIPETENLLQKMRQRYGAYAESPVSRMRYARCFFHCDIDYSLGIMQDVLPQLEKTHNSKWANACRLDIQFLLYLKGANTESIFNGIGTIKESIPQYVSLYRSNLRLFAACALVNIKGGVNGNALDEYYYYRDAYLNERGHRFAKERAYDDMIDAALAYLKGDYNKMLTLLKSVKTRYRHLGPSYFAPLKHNLSITTIPESSNRRVMFYNMNNLLNPSYFYLDPRMW